MKIELRIAKYHRHTETYTECYVSEPGYTTLQEKPIYTVNPGMYHCIRIYPMNQRVYWLLAVKAQLNTCTCAESVCPWSKLNFFLFDTLSLPSCAHDSLLMRADDCLPMTADNSLPMTDSWLQSLPVCPFQNWMSPCLFPAWSLFDHFCAQLNTNVQNCTLFVQNCTLYCTKLYTLLCTTVHSTVHKCTQLYTLL